MTMTSENVRNTNLLFLMAEQLARGRVQPSIADALRLGRTTALQKPNGGVRGIVAGDILRRLVARTVAQQMGKVVEAATRPHQYAMFTRAGSECIARVIQVLTESDPRSTVLSIDGVGAYDSISRKAMLEASSACQEGRKSCLLSASSKAGLPSICGKTMKGLSTESLKEKGVNKGMPSCPCSSPLDNTRH